MVNIVTDMNTGSLSTVWWADIVCVQHITIITHKYTLINEERKSHLYMKYYLCHIIQLVTTRDVTAEYDTVLPSNTYKCPSSLTSVGR